MPSDLRKRLPGVVRVVIQRATDEAGRLTFTGRGDPFALLVADAHRVLEDLDVPRTPVSRGRWRR
jgi:hypothetical protein